MQHYAARRIADRPQDPVPSEQHTHADHAAFLEDRRMALAAAAVLCAGVLVASYFLMQGARHYALVADCAIPTQASCESLVLR
jgi:hypothetical protein